MNRFLYEDIVIGMTQTFAVTVSQEMMEHFLAMTGDCNPLHREEEYARRMGFAGRVVYGMLTASLFSTLAGVYLPGERSIIRKVQADFPRPVLIGDTLQVSGTVIRKDDRFSFFEMKTEIRNQRGEKVCRGRMEIGFLEETRADVSGDE